MITSIKSRAMFATAAMIAGLTLCGGTHALLAQEADTTKPENVPQTEPAFFVHADVDRLDRTYREGDPLFVTAICEVDAHLYVIYKQADGKSFLVYPNAKQPNNFVKAKQKVQVPAGEDQFRWRIGAPYGKEMVFVVASKKPLEGLNDPKLREQRFNELTTQQTQTVAANIQGANANDWARDSVEITTKPKGEAAVASQARRYGVFFGVKNYQYRDEALAAGQELVDAGKADSVWDPDMPFAENNVAVISSMFKSMGKLDDLKTYLSKEATKANLKYAITQWLPSVSKPGDTVFIYWSSHGGQLPDDDGDEADGKDEWLLCSDYCDVPILKQLMRKKEQGKLDAKLASRVDELVQVAQQAGDHADEALCRYTGVSDDLFGHWLQSLAGRQVVVILDTCHSGGFYQQEKTLAAPNKNVSFDFLDGETSRLKDLGQSESALMSACTAEKSCYINHASDRVLEYLRQQQPENKGEAKLDDQIEPMFVFSYYLAEALASMDSPADINNVHARCIEGMKSYFPKVNEVQRLKKGPELIPHEAILYNRCTKPVIIKP